MVNIWIEGVGGVGKTELAAALGKALDVTPLCHVNPDQLPEGQRYNVIDRHADITNMVYRSTFPEKFCEHSEKCLRLGTNNDLYIHLKYAGGKVEGYSSTELYICDLAYSRFFDFLKNNLVQVDHTGNYLEFLESVTYPAWQKYVRVGDKSLLDDPKKRLEVEVREILKVVKEMEHNPHVANK